MCKQSVSNNCSREYGTNSKPMHANDNIKSLQKRLDKAHVDLAAVVNDWEIEHEKAKQLQKQVDMLDAELNAMRDKYEAD